MTRDELVERMARAADPALWEWWDKITDQSCPPHVAIEIIERELARHTAALTELEKHAPVSDLLSGEFVVVHKAAVGDAHQAGFDHGYESGHHDGATARPR